MTELRGEYAIETAPAWEAVEGKSLPWECECGTVIGWLVTWRKRSGKLYRAAGDETGPFELAIKRCAKCGRRYVRSIQEIRGI